MASYKKTLGVLNKKYNANENTLEHIANIKDIKSAYSNNLLEKVAQDFLKKWFGKTRHQLSIFDKSSAYRLDIYKMAGELRNTINQIMDLLEKDMNVDSLDPLVMQVNKDMSSLRGLMRALHNIEPVVSKDTKSLDNVNLMEKYF